MNENKQHLLEIEIDGPNNENLCFRPLQGQRIRGRFDLRRIPEPCAAMLNNLWPEPIPGQRIRLSWTDGETEEDSGQGVVVEPLHLPEFATLKAKIQGREMQIALQESPQAVRASQWLHAMQGAVENGVARVVTGELPQVIRGKSFSRRLGPQAGDDAALRESITEMASQMKVIAEATQTNAEAIRVLLERLTRKP